MKTSNYLSLLAFLCLFTSFGCTKVIYTQQQVMEQYPTKPDVVNRFGLPSQKRSGEGIEEWLYDYGTVYTGVGVSNYTNTNTVSYLFDNNRGTPLPRGFRIIA